MSAPPIRGPPRAPRPPPPPPPPPRPAPVARPVARPPSAPEIAPIPASRQVPGGGFVKALLALPKPILFGLCGAVGGLVGALLLGELLWLLLSPREVEAPAPRVQM